MRLLNLNIGIKINNTRQVIEFLKTQNADICTFQEAMNAVDTGCYDIYKSKNEIEKIDLYRYSEFVPLFIAEGISKNDVIQQILAVKLNKVR